MIRGVGFSMGILGWGSRSLVGGWWGEGGGGGGGWGWCRLLGWGGGGGVVSCWVLGLVVAGIGKGRGETGEGGAV